MQRSQRRIVSNEDREEQDVLYLAEGHDLIVARSDAGTCMQLMMLTTSGVIVDWEPMTEGHIRVPAPISF